MAAVTDPRSTWADLLAEGRAPRFALICLGVWLNAADSLVTDTIMPSVAADLGGYGYFAWAVAGYFLGAIVAGASSGRLSEQLGLRPAMALAGLAYGAGCVASAAAPSIELFLAGRVRQGVGAGWVVGFCYVAIASLFPERHLARVFAAISGVWGVAVLLGPLVGGAFAAAGLGLLALAVRIDAGARVRLLPKGSGDLGGVCGAGYATVFLLSASAVGFAIYAPAILQELRGLSPLAAGYVIGAEAVGWTAAALLVSRAGPVWGDRWIRIGAVTVVVGLALLGLVLKAAPLALVVAAATLLGAGFGVCWSFISRAILGALSDEDRAIGSSAMATVRQTGAASGAAISGAVANAVGFSGGLTAASAEATAVWIFVAGTPIAALGALAAWRLAQGRSANSGAGA